mgnify:CR=1 FL=1
MNIMSKNEIFEILKLPFDEFNNTFKVKAKEMFIKNNGNKVSVTALLGYDNICKNQCTYCGMRAGNSLVKRYRMGIEDIKKVEESVKKTGIKKVFLISGEDPKYDFKDIVNAVSFGKKIGLNVSLAAGELSFDKYKELKESGLDEYVLKFETSNKELFSRIKPSSTYEKRMSAIYNIKELKMELASGNIVGLPNQSLEDVAQDIVLMDELEISWAPIIPYMPVPNTPLALEGERGSVRTTLKEISILRLIMPKVNITAQQPGEDLKNGLSDLKGNIDALEAGANILFVEMLPEELAQDFTVIDRRMIKGMENVNKLVTLSAMTV